MSGEGFCSARQTRARPERAMLAEREACLAVMDKLRLRLGAIEVNEQDGIALVDGESFRLELRRFDVALEDVRAGLHRAPDPSTEETD